MLIYPYGSSSYESEVFKSDDVDLVRDSWYKHEQLIEVNSMSR